MTNRIYFDHNATTRPLPEVIAAMDRCWREGYANPGSQHAEGRAARRALESSRETIAAIVGAHPEEVVFTSGGTEASNLALLGLAEWMTGGPGRGFPEPAPIVALTAGEHPATAEACGRLLRQGWRKFLIDVGSHGSITADAVRSIPWDVVRLVSVILAHNETGVIQDLSSLAPLCREQGVPLHLDAVQAVGRIPVDFHRLDAAALSFAAHKFHGPRGVGVLLLKRGTRIVPQMFGGHQESERRPGTVSVALAVGMAKALELWQSNHAARTAHVLSLRTRLESRLLAECAPAVLHGGGAPRLPNTANVAFPGVDGAAVLVALDLAGVACSLGSTCASGSAEPAPALLAMGVPRDVALASVRFSLGFENTLEEVDEAAGRIARVVHDLRNRLPE